jgi:hypothetical protein
MEAIEEMAEAWGGQSGVRSVGVSVGARDNFVTSMGCAMHTWSQRVHELLVGSRQLDLVRCYCVERCLLRLLDRRPAVWWEGVSGWLASTFALVDSQIFLLHAVLHCDERLERASKRHGCAGCADT